MEKGSSLIVMMETIKMVMDAPQIVKFKLDGLVQVDQAPNQVHALKELLTEHICN